MRPSKSFGAVLAWLCVLALLPRLCFYPPASRFTLSLLLFIKSIFSLSYLDLNFRLSPFIPLVGPSPSKAETDQDGGGQNAE